MQRLAEASQDLPCFHPVRGVISIDHPERLDEPAVDGVSDDRKIGIETAHGAVCGDERRAEFAAPVALRMNVRKKRIDDGGTGTLDRTRHRWWSHTDHLGGER